VRSALETLPWVEKWTIDPDRASRTVKFGITDKSKFSEAAVRAALPARYANGMKVLEGP